MRVLYYSVIILFVASKMVTVMKTLHSLLVCSACVQVYYLLSSLLCLRYLPLTMTILTLDILLSVAGDQCDIDSRDDRVFTGDSYWELTAHRFSSQIDKLQINKHKWSFTKL